MTLNWVTQLRFDPKWLGVGVEQTAFTHELIEAGGVFSVCIIDREDRAIVRKFTKPVEVDLDGGDAQRLRRTTSASPARRSSTRRSRTSTARCATGWWSATTRFFVGEVVDGRLPEGRGHRGAAMEDTRMNYGG